MTQRRKWMALVLLSLLGCSAPASEESDDGEATQGATAAAGCDVSICMAGAVRRTDGANPPLSAFCSELPGLVRDCSTSPCDPLYTMGGVDKAFEDLIDALDKNHDGRVNAKDPACKIHIVGYSWGGKNAQILARKLIEDMRVSKERSQVDQLIVFDPYIPLNTLHVPKGVKKFWEYRHSSSPKNDCSQSGVLGTGPYVGIVPTCDASVRCRDYDFSLDRERTYDPFNSWPLRGEQIDHCTVVNAALYYAAYNIIHDEDAPDAPPAVPVRVK